MVGLGLTAPMAAQMLAARRGARHAQPKPAFTPTKRGGGGALKVLWWQGPTLLNPHFAVGTKDRTARGSSTSRWPPSTPTATSSRSWPPRSRPLQNGGVAKDGRSVTWKLKTGVQWHDGKPFTADDFVFTWEYAADPATAATTLGNLQGHPRSRSSTATRSRSSSRSRRPFWADASAARPATSSPSTSSSRSRARSRARRRPTSSRSAPARTGSWTSSRATSCGPS